MNPALPLDASDRAALDELLAELQQQYTLAEIVGLFEQSRADYVECAAHAEAVIAELRERLRCDHPGCTQTDGQPCAYRACPNLKAAP